VNEKLHNLYISSIFGAEKKEMEREGLDVKLKMPDLKVLDVLLLMANGNSKLAPYGLFQLVADKSGSGMGTADMKKRSTDLHRELVKQHGNNTKVFKKSKG
jgi:hypothetical protein